MPKHKGNELKMLIVQQVFKGQTIYSLAQQFNISKDTIKRWVQRFQQTGSVERTNRQPVSYKLTAVMRNKFDDFDVTEQWLGKMLKINDITRKHVHKYHSPYYRYGKVVDRSQLKSRFYDQVKEYPFDRIIFLDETAVQLYMHRNYARCNGRQAI